MDGVENDPLGIEINLVASCMGNQVARRNFTVHFQAIPLSFVSQLRTFLTFTSQPHCRFLVAETAHSFLALRVPGPVSECVHSQGKRAKYVSDQAYTLLDNCTPTVGSRACVLSCVGKEALE